MADYPVHLPFGLLLRMDGHQLKWVLKPIGWM
jgi:hypothetical protein